jgi:hypothetical protein
MRVILVALLFIPTAMAGSVPELLFFAPGSSPLEGGMSAEKPADMDASTSLILPGSAELPSSSFVRDGNHSDRIYGPLLVGLWIGPSPTAVGNISAVISDGESILGSATVDVAIDPENLPDPQSLVPPDPTNPEQAVAYIAAQAMLAVMQPPAMLDFGFIDVAVDPDANITVSFFLEGEPIALGAASMQYDGALSPSFVYVPFYEPEPAASSSSPSGSTPGSSATGSSAPGSSAPGSGSSSEPGSSSGEPPSLGIGNEPEPESEESKDSPGLGVFAIVGIAAVAMLRRYKS